MLDSMDGVWVHDPLKPKDWKGERVSYVEAKRDGWRVTFFMQEGENGLCVFGRKQEAHLEMSHLLDWMPEYRALTKLAAGTSVDGELWAPGLPASAVVTCMKAQEGLRFSPFAVPRVQFQPNAATMGDVRYVLKQHFGLDPVPQLPYVGEDRAELLDAARFFDAEGVVLKAEHYAGWFKVKEEYTVDLVVTDIKPGDKYGKYKDTTGSLHGGVWREGVMTEVACCSGMDDELRRSITDADRGRVFEATYQYLGAGKRLRHPNFVRWRDDKPAADCTWDQLERNKR